ncbi:ketopantoate reductase family protein [Geothrix sp. 21YS21S-2]|uniref:ketopantoate reductase family protein n=1 Tax=Geothrix sp. 21YS21S-2 TaxID=3068893 RepID=UPI0027BAB239|nr:2-dehydropantoate 2-reductase [Geothrix sp. 21YS21S-2]
MRILIVGLGALGGVIATRLQAAGIPVHLAVRSAESAARVKAAGLRVTGAGGEASAAAADVAPLDAYAGAAPFDLILLATKAQDALAAAPALPGLLAADGAILPIQNGFVPQMVADRLGDSRVVGGLSNLGATMRSPGVYEQRNAGHLLIGERAGGEGDRTARIARTLGPGIEVRVTRNLRGAVWSKLLLNCSVTTLGAVAGLTMRRYLALPGGRDLFIRTYDEALSVALASGDRPEPMVVEPVPPGWDGRSRPGPEFEAWLEGILGFYGDIKASMLQDFEQGRPTEIDFINGHVVAAGRRLGLATPVNAAITETVRAITRGEAVPGPGLLAGIRVRPIGTFP